MQAKSGEMVLIIHILKELEKRHPGISEDVYNDVCDSRPLSSSSIGSDQQGAYSNAIDVLAEHLY